MNRSLDGDGQTPRQGRPTAYEVACQEGMGFILLDTARPRDKGRADPVQYLNCLEAKEAADERVLPYQCRLKENHDADRGMQALATHAGLDCDVTAARGLGHTEDKSFFEIACARPAAQLQKGPTDNGWVLVTTRAVLGDRPVSAFSCFDTEGMPKLRCHLTNVHGTIEALRRFVVKTDPGCAPVKQRLVGPSRGGGEVFEVACRNGDGYMAHRASDRSFDTAVACRDAALTGRCRLVAAEPKS